MVLKIIINSEKLSSYTTLDDNTPVLKPTQKFIAKSKQKIKDCLNWLLDDMLPKPKVVDETLESFKNLIKNCTTRETLTSN